MAVLTDYKGLDVVESASGAGGVALTDNFKTLADRAPYEAASNPGVNDDSSDGFAAGDQWLNTSTQTMWMCISASVGAAVWRSLYSRSSTVLTLIPEESGESVEVAGAFTAAGVITAVQSGFAGLVLTRTPVTGGVGLSLNPGAYLLSVGAGAGSTPAFFAATSTDAFFYSLGGSSPQFRVKRGAVLGWSSSTSDAVSTASDTGLSRNAAGVVEINNGTPGTFRDLLVRHSTLSGDLTLGDGSNAVAGTSTGSKIGTGTSQKLGFWNATPVVQQVLATGGGATVDNVISLLQTLGLCRQS